MPPFNTSPSHLLANSDPTQPTAQVLISLQWLFCEEKFYETALHRLEETLKEELI